MGLTWHSYEGRRSWLIENDQLRLIMLEGGGHVAEMALRGNGAAGINPLWQPGWPTAEPSRFSAERDSGRYGDDPGAKMRSGVRGHYVCFDYWGAPSAEEWRQGMSIHGEAGIVQWRSGPLPGDAAESVAREVEFTAVAELARSAARLTRTIRLRAGEPVAYFEETAANLLALDRPIGWVQHVTFGPPFVRCGETLLDVPASRGWSRPGAVGRVPAGVEFEWPFLTGVDGARVDLRVAAPEQRSSFVLGLQIDPGRKLGFVAAATPGLGLLVAYVFPREQYPWVNHWEENRNRTAVPWNGRTLAVALEFGNTMVSGSRRALVAAPPEKYGVPAYGWLPAGATQTKRYIAMLARIPRDYRGTADIRADAGGFVLIERPDTEGHARQLQIPCDCAFLGA